MIHVNKKVADFYIKNGVNVSHIVKPNSEIVTGQYEAKKTVQGMNKFNRIPQVMKDRFHEYYSEENWTEIKNLFKEYGVIKCSGCTSLKVVKRWAEYAVENNLI